MLDFPEHNSDHLQPVNVAVCGPLKDAIGVGCHDFLISNPGRVITIGDGAGILKVADQHVVTEANGVVVFKATGIESFNSKIFLDEIFEPIVTMDRPLQTAVSVAAVNAIPVSAVGTIPAIAIADDLAIPLCSNSGSLTLSKALRKVTQTREKL